jgi:hypothetical protein
MRSKQPLNQAPIQAALQSTRHSPTSQAKQAGRHVGAGPLSPLITLAGVAPALADPPSMSRVAAAVGSQPEALAAAAAVTS